MIDRDHARAIQAEIRRQIELLKRKAAADPLETGYDDAIAHLQQQLRDGDYL